MAPAMIGPARALLGRAHGEALARLGGLGGHQDPPIGRCVRRGRVRLVHDPSALPESDCEAQTDRAHRNSRHLLLLCHLFLDPSRVRDRALGSLHHGGKALQSRMLGRNWRSQPNDERSVYYWAWKNDIPVFCPALTDGSLGDMLYFHTFKTSPQQLKCDIVEDIRKINTISVRAKRAGMIILGGGVIKHHIANACLMRNGAESAVYINTGQEFDGSDAGARPDEAVSWGKIKVGADAHSFLPSSSSGFYRAPAPAPIPVRTFSPPAGISHDIGPRRPLSDRMLPRGAKRSLRKTCFAALIQSAIPALNVLRRIDST
ncbi:hypothetical protein BN1723_017597 [Verticillium longisporum]|uniref:deoxyhypusine synthase n=1 Tax=Verticillium longisporum TaxID=100787 RepID=A0A0G4L7N4_VERLO|nr:hypothetical protein BN1723_017597 [Verticillium longisporum]